MAVQCPECGGAHPKWDCSATDAKKASWRKQKESGAVAERDGGKPTRNAAAKHVAPVLPTSADESAVYAGSNPAGSAKFDKTAYQKAYMVEWRKRQKEKLAGGAK